MVDGNAIPTRCPPEGRSQQIDGRRARSTSSPGSWYGNFQGYIRVVDKVVRASELAQFVQRVWYVPVCLLWYRWVEG